MEQPKEKSPIPKISAISVSPEDVLKMKAAIPILKVLNENNPNFIKLLQLIKEVAGTAYAPEKKYSLMFKIVQLGNIVEELLDDSVKQGVTIETFKSVADRTALDKLSLKQQYALFKIYRNISADFFQILFEDKAVLFLESFIQLCRGMSIKAPDIGAIYTSLNKATRGEDFKKMLQNSGFGNAIFAKLMNQMGYFLKKSADFMARGDIDAACMALLASGSCARIFNRTKIREIPQATILAIIREKLSHIYTKGYNEAEFLELLKETTRPEEIEGIVLKIEAEANSKEVNIKDYYSKKETSTGTPESPRAFDRNYFKL